MSHSIRSGNKGGRSIGSAYSSGGNPQKEYLQILQGGGNKKELSKSDLKLQLALEAHKFKEFAKSPSPSGKSPRQKYIGCDLNANDPITLETLGDLHLKKIKYLSKIKTKLPDGKIITHCYDTIPFYNYILSCYNKNEEPKNLAIGRELLTTEQKNEVFKKIKYFTKQPTLKSNINKKYFLKAKYNTVFKNYKLEALINIGTIDFDVINYNKIDKPPLRRRYPSGINSDEYDLYDNYVAERRERRARGLLNVTSSTPTSSSSSSKSYDLYEVEPTLLHTGPILSRDDILFEDTDSLDFISNLFNVSFGTQLLHVISLHCADGSPYVIEDRWINLIALPHLADVSFATLSANEWLLQNTPFTHGDISFGATNASAEEASILKTKAAAALFTIERTTRDLNTDTKPKDRALTNVRLLFRPGYQVHTKL